MVLTRFIAKCPAFCRFLCTVHCGRFEMIVTGDVVMVIMEEFYRELKLNLPPDRVQAYCRRRQASSETS